MDLIKVSSYGGVEWTITIEFEEDSAFNIWQ